MANKERRPFAPPEPIKRSLRLPIDLRDSLAREAKARAMTQNQLIVLAVKAFLEQPREEE